MKFKVAKMNEMTLGNQYIVNGVLVTLETIRFSNPYRSIFGLNDTSCVNIGGHLIGMFVFKTQNSTEIEMSYDSISEFLEVKEDFKFGK